MSILKRFKTIMAANVNSLLDKAEDPEKMVDQYLRDMKSDLEKVKEETASVMASAEKARRDLAETDEEIAKMQAFAEKALVLGEENDARQFLAKKAELLKTREVKQSLFDSASANAQKMREMHDKLVKDIATLNDRKDAIKTKVAAAKAQEHINEINEKISDIDITDGLSALGRMEEKADHMLDVANAKAELDKTQKEEKTTSELAKKYEENTEEIDAELAALKAKLSL